MSGERLLRRSKRVKVIQEDDATLAAAGAEYKRQRSRVRSGPADAQTHEGGETSDESTVAGTARAYPSSRRRSENRKTFSLSAIANKFKSKKKK